MNPTSRYAESILYVDNQSGPVNWGGLESEFTSTAKVGCELKRNIVIEEKSIFKTVLGVLNLGAAQE